MTNEADTPTKDPATATGTTSPPPSEQSDAKTGNLSILTTGWTSYIAIGAALVLLLFATVEVARRSVHSKADGLTRDLIVKEEETACPAVIGTDKKSFIDKQRLDIAKFANVHRKTAVEFYGYFYSTFAVISVFGLLALVTGVVIAKQGYNAASPHLILVFLLSSGVVLIYQGFFGVFQQRSNVDNNAKLFAAYSRLHTKVDTYCATGKIPVVDPATVFSVTIVQPKAPSTLPTPVSSPKPESNSPGKATTFYIALEPDEFINYVGWQMEQLRSIAIVFDDAKVVAISSEKLLILPD